MRYGSCTCPSCSSPCVSSLFFPHPARTLTRTQAKGVPDMATRDLVATLAAQYVPFLRQSRASALTPTRAQVTVLVDADPWGLDVFRVYAAAAQAPLRLLLPRFNADADTPLRPDERARAARIVRAHPHLKYVPCPPSTRCH